MKPTSIIIGCAVLAITALSFFAPLPGAFAQEGTGSLEETAPADERERFRFDLGVTFSRFEQQVKGELGGARGERLVEEMAFGLNGFGSYRFWELLSVGVFAQLDAGNRNAARFDGFDETGATVIRDEVGGSYWEFWLGPFVRIQWKAVFVEVGWGALGLRGDSARDDLPAVDGSTDGAFQTSPTVAWLFSLGANVPIHERLDIALRITYRIRYYVSRGGDDLTDEIVHGTQNYTPFVGVAYRLE